jgi:hypothetical protein
MLVWSIVAACHLLHSVDSETNMHLNNSVSSEVLFPIVAFLISFIDGSLCDPLL